VDVTDDETNTRELVELSDVVWCGVEWREIRKKEKGSEIQQQTFGSEAKRKDEEEK
jgi:hypothetical protein